MQFSTMFESYNFWWQKILSLQPTQDDFKFWCLRIWNKKVFLKRSPFIIINPPLGWCHHIREGHMWGSQSQPKQSKAKNCWLKLLIWLLHHLFKTQAAHTKSDTKPHQNCWHGWFIFSRSLLYFVLLENLTGKLARLLKTQTQTM